MSFDHLQGLIKAKKNPTVAGLDPKPEYVPPHIRKASYDKYGETLEGAADAILQFNKGLMDAHQAGRHWLHRSGLQRRLAGQDPGGRQAPSRL